MKNKIKSQGIGSMAELKQTSALQTSVETGRIPSGDQEACLTFAPRGNNDDQSKEVCQTRGRPGQVASCTRLPRPVSGSASTPYAPPPAMSTTWMRRLRDVPLWS